MLGTTDHSGTSGFIANFSQIKTEFCHIGNQASKCVEEIWNMAEKLSLKNLIIPLQCTLFLIEGEIVVRYMKERATNS